MLLTVARIKPNILYLQECIKLCNIGVDRNLIRLKVNGDVRMLGHTLTKDVGTNSDLACRHLHIAVSCAVNKYYQDSIFCISVVLSGQNLINTTCLGTMCYFEYNTKLYKHKAWQICLDNHLVPAVFRNTTYLQTFLENAA